MALRSPDPGRLADLALGWVGRPVLVVGDAMLDEWRFAESDRLCREAPAPVLTLRKREESAGGAANTAVNLAALAARPVLVAPVGSDPAGQRLRDCLAAAGVTDATVTVAGRETPVKRRLLADQQILLREDSGATAAPLPRAAVRRLLDALDAAGPTPALVICDYGLGAVAEPIRDWLARHRDDFPVVAVDAHDLAPWRRLSPTVVTPSFAEVAALGVGRPADGSADRAALVVARADELLERTGSLTVAVTLDGDGAIVVGAGGVTYRSRTRPVPASHAVGAGDAYLAGFALALTCGADVPAAAEIAQRTAALTVAGLGTCTCRHEDLIAGLSTGDAASTIVDAPELRRRIAAERERGARIVFTNGCFDVLHRGHVGYLEQARGLGDVLVVAVNSDDSVRRLKGDDRPVNPVEDRVAVLAALSCVDYVVVFAEDSPTALIEQVSPDVYVKGGDYPPELVPEAPLVRRLGGRVHTLGYVPDRSTSAIIERIRSHSPIPEGRPGVDSRGGPGDTP